MAFVCGCGPAPAAPSFPGGAARAAPACPLDICARTPTVLPRLLRMRSSKDFRRTTRRGLRVSRSTLIFHAVRAPDDVASTRDAAGRSGPRIGFVVSGALGNAVTRNRVKRRLRHLAAAHVADAPVGIDPFAIDPFAIDIVVRALPGAVTDPAAVPTEFGSAWHEAVSRLTARRLREDGGAR
jgi:ribonuclease P protein component